MNGFLIWNHLLCLNFPKHFFVQTDDQSSVHLVVLQNAQRPSETSTFGWRNPAGPLKPQTRKCRQIEAKKHVRKEPLLQVLMRFSYSDITSNWKQDSMCLWLAFSWWKVLQRKSWSIKCVCVCLFICSQDDLTGLQRKRNSLPEGLS